MDLGSDGDRGPHGEEDRSDQEHPVRRERQVLGEEERAADDERDSAGAAHADPRTTRHTTGRPQRGVVQPPPSAGGHSGPSNAVRGVPIWVGTRTPCAVRGFNPRTVRPPVLRYRFGVWTRLRLAIRWRGGQSSRPSSGIPPASKSSSMSSSRAASTARGDRPRQDEQVSHPQPELRVLLDDGPHAGQTISVEPDAKGQPPERITVRVPAEGLQVREHRHESDESAQPPLAYQLRGSDEDLGLWVYQHVAD